MNRKTFEIIEILFPIVKRAETKEGKLDYSRPEAFLFYLPHECIEAYKSIWAKDNTPLTITQGVFRLCLNIGLTITITPIVFLIWAISQLCFAARYDKKKKKKGEKSHLFLTYSAMAALFGLLIFMIADCKANGKLSDKVNKDINDTSQKISTPKKQTRTIERSIIEDIDAESIPVEFIEEIAPEEEIVPEEMIVTTEPEPEETEPVVTEGEIIEIDEEYTIQRKTR